MQRALELTAPRCLRRRRAGAAGNRKSTSTLATALPPHFGGELRLDHSCANACCIAPNEGNIGLVRFAAVRCQLRASETERRANNSRLIEEIPQPAGFCTVWSFRKWCVSTAGNSQAAQGRHGVVKKAGAETKAQGESLIARKTANPRKELRVPSEGS